MNSRRPSYFLATTLLIAWAASVQGAPVDVFVSVAPQRQLVQRVGGEHVRVWVMVQPDRSPATYEPTPRQMAALSEADVYFRIGVPFEQVWMERLRAANPSMRVQDLRQGLALRELDHGGHDHGQGQPADPHVWTDPMRVRAMAGRIRDTLAELDAVHAEDFERGYRELARDLEALDAEIREILAGARGSRFLVFHPSWGYFAQAYGLEQVAVEQAGKEPGARSLARLIEQAREEAIAVIFVQPQFSSAVAQSVAEAVGARIVRVDPLAQDYLGNMRRVARAFAQALQ